MKNTGGSPLSGRASRIIIYGFSRLIRRRCVLTVARSRFPRVARSLLVFPPSPLRKWVTLLIEKLKLRLFPPSLGSWRGEREGAWIRISRRSGIFFPSFFFFFSSLYFVLLSFVLIAMQSFNSTLFFTSTFWSNVPIGQFFSTERFL